MAENLLASERTEGAQDFDFFIADRIGVEPGGRLHRGEAEELQEMVLDHVTERAGFVVVARAAFHAERLAGGDLDMVDVAGIPHRLENRVGEAHDHDVLRGLLPEVVVDAVGLGFLEGGLDEIVQPARAGQVGAEGFLDNHARPRSRRGRVESAFAEVFQNHLELVGRDGEVKKPVPARAAGRVQLLKMAGEGDIALGVVEFTPVVGDGVREILPQLVIDLLAGEFANGLAEFLPENLARFVSAGETHHTDRLRKRAVGG